MSLYNMVRGFNPNAAICLAMLGLEANKISRFRDAWLSDDGKNIIVLTRTGGGNRDDYAGSNEEMASVDGFVSDEDDDFDSTFARFTYKVPDKYISDTALIASLMVDAGKSAEKQGPGAIMRAFEPQEPAPKISADDPRVIAAADAYERLVTAMKAS